MDTRSYIHDSNYFVAVRFTFFKWDSSFQMKAVNVQVYVIADWFSRLRGSGAFHHHKSHIAAYT